MGNGRGQCTARRRVKEGLNAQDFLWVLSEPSSSPVHGLNDLTEGRCETQSMVWDELVQRTEVGSEHVCFLQP